MKNLDIKFEDIPVKKPSYKSVEKKLVGFINELKAAPDYKSGLKVINAFERYMSKFSTNITVIQIRYSLNTQDETIAKLQDQVDEMMPLVSNLINMWNKLMISLPYRAELEKKFSPYYFKMIENSLKSFDENTISICKKIIKSYI